MACKASSRLPWQRNWYTTSPTYRCVLSQGLKKGDTKRGALSGALHNILRTHYLWLIASFSALSTIVYCHNLN